jgi:pimeloyl-ACP methyl ester carboxylesterase
MKFLFDAESPSFKTLRTPVSPPIAEWTREGRHGRAACGVHGCEQQRPISTVAESTSNPHGTHHVDDHHQRWRPHLLVAHGDDDQIIPIQAAVVKAVTLLPNVTLNVYPGAPHGLNRAYERRFNNDLRAFLTRQAGRIQRRDEAHSS